MRTRKAIHQAWGCLAALIVVAGCGGDPIATPAPSGVVTLLDTSAWPGGTIRLAAEDFRTWGDDVEVLLDATVLPTTRLDPTTVAAILPAGLPAMITTPTARYAGHEYPLSGSLTVAGFASSQDLAGSAHIAWDAYAIMLGGHPYAVGGNLDGALAMINLASGAVTTVPDALDWNRLRGPGMSYVPGTWVLRGSGGLEDWILDGVPRKVADHPEFVPSSTRQAAHLAANVWLTTTNQTWSMWTRDNVGSSYAVTAQGAGFDDAQGILLSPDGARAVVRVDRVLAGVPVFDATAGTVAFATDLTSVLGAAFTPNGATLALAGSHTGKLPGGGTQDPSRVELVRATDGVVLATRELETEAFAVAFVPGTDWLLVGVSMGSSQQWRPALLVLDATDLSTVATLSAPAMTPTCGTIGNCFGAVVGVDGAAATVFWSWNGTPPHLWHFRLLEPPLE